MSRGSVHHVTGGQVIDAAFPPDGWWDDFPACGRYASLPTSNPKNLKQHEIDRAADLDHAFMYFVEQSETTPINGTTQDDVALASQAAQMATDFDLPDGVPFMFAVDTDGRPYMDQIRAAFVAYRTRVPLHWPVGAYAGSDVIDQLIADGTIEYGHIPAALSWSSTTRPVDNITVFNTWPNGRPTVRHYRTPAAHLLQYPSRAYLTSRVDPNDVLQSFPLWYPGRTAPSPQPGGSDLRQFVINAEEFPPFDDEWGDHHVGPIHDGFWPPQFVVFEIVPGGKRWVSGPEWGSLNGGATSVDPRVGFTENWTTGRIQNMPNVRFPTQAPAPAARELKGVQIDSVPGRATPLY